MLEGRRTVSGVGTGLRRRFGRRPSALLLPILALLALAAAASPAAAAPPKPFGHDCSPANGVLFCPTVDLTDRVPSFDGAPLDADVTLPAGTQAGEELPTVVMMHGFGGDKTDFEADTPDGGSPDNDTTYHWNSNFFAKQGYAVLNYTARGFGRSCGREQNSNATPDCLATKSYLHLVDQRWEIRDTQYLLGLLADQDVTVPDRIAVTGISYGGGQSIMLAYLRDRIRLMDDSLAPWRSPAGKPMEIAAAFPRWPWSDLADALLPNGRFRDMQVASQDESLEPVGIPILSYISGLFALGGAAGTYCGAPPRTPPCNDPSADILGTFPSVLAGEPISPSGRAFLQEIHDFHSGYGLADETHTAAPLLLESGWTDDLFPPEQSIRVYNELRREDPNFPVALQFGDLGHARGSNKERSDRAFNNQGAAFFRERIGDVALARAPRPGKVTAYTQTCPQDAPTNGPFVASSYAELGLGKVRFSDASTQSVLSAGGNAATGAALDPITGGGDACRQLPDEDEPGTAVLRGGVSRGYTLLGLPTVRAKVATTGPFGQLDSRLWDVAPDGQQTLVTRGAYRLRDNQSGTVAFEMNGNGYCFADGHVPKLELLGKDEPRLRPSNGAFSISVSDVSIDLPTAERDPVPRLRVTATPARVTSGERRRFEFEVTSREQVCATSSADQPKRGVPVPGSTVRFGGRSVTTGADGTASLRLRLGGTGRREAKATKAGFDPGRTAVRLRAAEDREGDGSGTSGPGTGDSPGDGGGGGGDSGSGGGADAGGTATLSSVSSTTEAGGSLPFTGLELAGLVLVGLALTGGGLALRGRSRARSS